MHLDDESCVASNGSKVIGFAENLEIVILRQEIEELKKLVVRNENVERMDGLELANYERILKEQLRDLAREITKVYKAKNARRI